MSATLNPSPFVLATLQNLSTMTASRGVGHIFSRPIMQGHSEARAFGGLDLAMARTGKDGPAKVRYGAIRVTPRSTGSAYSKSPGVHHAIDRGYDNPGVRFGDHIRSGRPVSAAGETSCHFSQTSVSKTSPIREMIKAARGGRRRTGSKAAAHVLYVERDGAAEKIDKYELLYGARFTSEMERRAADRSAVAQQAYIERAGAAEGIERVPGRPITDDDLDALDEGSFGTIGNTVAERTRFWEAVEAAEATPKGDRIVVKPADNPLWWERAVKETDRAPAAARAAIQAAHAGGGQEPFEIKLPTDKAFAFHQWAVGIDTDAPLEISPGRGGRTQTRIIAELPHELDGRERLQVVRDFTNHLAAKGFPFWAVIHAPDDNNDARNYHVHIAYYDRPAAQMKRPDGKVVWDFEVQEERRYSNRTKYLVRPHQQNRLRETNEQDWVTTLRKHWETSTNRVLEDAGQTKRYNLGTYASMGIALEPHKHINPRTFNKERKGELTEDGPVLARRQWDAAQDAALRDHQSQAERRFARINTLAETATAGMERHPQRELAIDLVERLRILGVEVSAEKARADLMLNLGRIVMDRVMSRPKLIMFDAMKDDDKIRRKSGKAATDPVPDRPVPSAEMFGPKTRNELSALIVAISDVALKLDKEHERFVQVANSRLKHVLGELKAWSERPMQPVTGAHLVRLRGERPLDPAEIERHRRNRIAVFQAEFAKRLEATLPEFLETVARRTGEREKDKASAASAASVTPAEKTARTAAPAEAAAAGQTNRAPTARADTPVRPPSEALGQSPHQKVSAPSGEIRRRAMKPPAYLTPASILEDRPSTRSSGRAGPTRVSENGAHPTSRGAPATPPARTPPSPPREDTKKSPAPQPQTPQPRTEGQQAARSANTPPTPVRARENARPEPQRSPAGEARPRATQPSPKPEMATSPVTAVAREPRTSEAATAAGATRADKPAAPRTEMAKPRPAVLPGPAPAISITDQDRRRAGDVATARPDSDASRRGPGVMPSVAVKPTGVEVSKAGASLPAGTPERKRLDMGRQRTPLPNIAAIMDEVQSRRDEAKAVARKAAAVSKLDAPPAEEFRPDAVEIAAERPTKKKPPRQRQRGRDFDFDR